MTRMMPISMSGMIRCLAAKYDVPAAGMSAASANGSMPATELSAPAMAASASGAARAPQR